MRPRGAAGFCWLVPVVWSLAWQRLRPDVPVWRDLGSVPGEARLVLCRCALGTLPVLPGSPLAGCAKSVTGTWFSPFWCWTAWCSSRSRFLPAHVARRATWIWRPIGFLNHNLGLNRIYTLGPLPPNYGAFYGVAQINHDYVPVPAAWVTYVQKNLDPLANPIQFNGFTPPPEDGMETRPEALRRRLPAYARVGVKYILSPPFLHPFAIAPVRMHKATLVVPLTLNTGEVARGSIGPGEYDTGRIWRRRREHRHISATCDGATDPQTLRPHGVRVGHGRTWPRSRQRLCLVHAGSHYHVRRCRSN